jgi:hypothetical protein
MQRSHHGYYDDHSDAKPQPWVFPDKSEGLNEVYELASKYKPDLTKTRKTEIFRETGHVLAWLDLAEPKKGAKFGYKATSFLVQRIARRALEEKRLKSNKCAASYVDIDVIESLFEAAVSSKDDCSVELRSFVGNVLGVLGLVRFTEGGEPIPTRVLRKLVGVCRQQDRYVRTGVQKPKGTTVDEEYVKQWLAIRQEAGLRIDPEVAEVGSWHAYTVDPYGVCPDLPEEARTHGRESFARSPRSDVWVLSDDLPGTTLTALSEQSGRRKQGKGRGQTTKAARSKKRR